MKEVTDLLFENQDLKYRDFHASLMPNIDKDNIIGVRIPVLRKLAKTADIDTDTFFRELPHKYYEENNLHAFLIEKIKDYEKTVAETERFLPYIDNWATCDSFLPKCYFKNKDKLIEKIYIWIDSEKTYTVRYAVGLLMGLYLDEDFKPEYMDRVSKVRSEEYYVNMMIAWYFATALAKQYDTAIEYILQNKLDTWVHNKSIQKACESRRITKEEKDFLKSLKRK